MSNKEIWFITGAGRGMGADFAKAALAAGHAVVATGRNSDAVSKALGQSNDVLTVTLDVTRLTDAEAAVRAAIGNPVTPRSSRGRLSPSRAKSPRRAASSPAPTRLPRQNRRSLISRCRSTRTAPSRRRSPLTIISRCRLSTCATVPCTGSVRIDERQGILRQTTLSQRFDCDRTVIGQAQNLEERRGLRTHTE